MWSSFVYKSNGKFTDFYTGNGLEKDLWIPGQPNGGSEQPCSLWGGLEGVGDTKGRLYDISC